MLRTLVTAPSTHLLEHEHARVMARSLSAGDTLTAALAGGPTLATVFPSNNSLADQLKMVARMVSTAAELGVADRVTTRVRHQIPKMADFFDPTPMESMS